MRGRLWALWVVQTLGGVFCLILELVIGCDLRHDGRGWKCGCSSDTADFLQRNQIHKRKRDHSHGFDDHMLQSSNHVYIFPTMGITLMGLMIICCSLPIMFIYFPQWGGMFCGPSKIVATEEDYYLSEWNSDEKEKGLQQASLKFADNSRSERGITKLNSATNAT
ncbi:hypothetical protein QYF36_002366 [Acer negundo]|nr:hypothetical protein QYF36_002366 [Acer negundo]